VTWPVDQWYAVAWDSEVDRKPFARTICGVPMMFYRKLDRSLVALRDACPHRLFPLSLGIKEDDNIRCKYHGMLFGPDGRALQMPLKDDPVNTSICVQSYPVAEKHRFVWVWVGDADKADVALIPALWPCSADGWTFDGGYYHVKAGYLLCLDNLMDLSHETYVHQGSIGQHEIMEAPLNTRVADNRVFVERWMPGIDAPPFWREALGKEGPVDRWQICEFIPPTSVIIDVGVALADAGATIEKHDQGVRGFVIDLFTPETDRSTHYFWGMARDFDISDAGFTARFKNAQSGVFLEDLDVFEAQQKSIDANPDLKLRSYNIDEGGVRARTIIKRLMREQETA
jgi:phenylpropionate dioxygenase-like ring-hydroxylating dioxygenase large terminal subunit